MICDLWLSSVQHLLQLLHLDRSLGKVIAGSPERRRETSAFPVMRQLIARIA